MNRHPVWGAELLTRVPGLEPVAAIVRFHHERWDGGGYPAGLSGTRIPLPSRIIAACDAHHAMTSDRPYRAALSGERALAELHAGAGTQFDPCVVAELEAVLATRGLSAR
jgi:HD-GYP domain-containing protein (c-di-GMP phosphodiesterase class II)